jgi:hypothetical protein
MPTLKLTLEDLKKSAKTIYYSSVSLWWTHSSQDLKESTEFGLLSQQKKNELFLADPNKSEDEKHRLVSLMNGLKEHQAKYGSHTPLDPFGAPLMMIDADKWISPAEKKPEHFKKYGLEAFMKTHHQNSKLGDEMVLFRTWDEVTEYLDGYYSVANTQL